MVINILIRTSYRPIAFQKCLESVFNSVPSGVKIYLFIGYDNPKALEYIPTDNCTALIDLTKESKLDKYFYNGYLNKMINHPLIQNGHILFLDDDDTLNPEFLRQGMRFIKNGFSYIFSFIRENGLQKPTPSMMQAGKIHKGYIGLPCLLLSTDHIGHVYFNQTEYSDYDAILLLNHKINLIWVNLPIVYSAARGYGVMEPEKKD